MADFLIQASGAGDTTLVAAPGPGKFIRVLHYHLTAGSPTVCRFYSGASDDGTLKDIVYSTNASGGGISTPNYQTPLFDCGVNEPLTLNLSDAANVGGAGQYSVYGSPNS